MQFSHFRHIRVFFENGPSASNGPSSGVPEEKKSDVETAREGVKLETTSSTTTTFADNLSKYSGTGMTLGKGSAGLKMPDSTVQKEENPSMGPANGIVVKKGDKGFERTQKVLELRALEGTNTELGNIRYETFDKLRELKQGLFSNLLVALGDNSVRESLLVLLRADDPDSTKFAGDISPQDILSVPGIPEQILNSINYFQVLFPDKKDPIYNKRQDYLIEYSRILVVGGVQDMNQSEIEKVKAELEHIDKSDKFIEDILLIVNKLPEGSKLRNILEQARLQFFAGDVTEILSIKGYILSNIILGDSKAEDFLRATIKENLGAWMSYGIIDDSINENTPIHKLLNIPALVEVLSGQDDFLSGVFSFNNPEMTNEMLTLFHSINIVQSAAEKKDTKGKDAIQAERDISSISAKASEFTKVENLFTNGPEKDVQSTIKNEPAPTYGTGVEKGDLYLGNQKEVSSNTLSNDWALKDAIESGLPVRLTGTDIVVHKVNDTTLSVKGCGDEWPAHKADEIPGLFRRIEACASIPFLRDHFLPAGGTFFTDIYDKINHDPALLHLKDPRDGMVPSYKFAAILMDIFGEMGKAQITDEKLGKIQVVPGKNQRYPENFASLKEYNSAQFSNYNTTTDNILDLAKKAPSSQLVKNGVIQPAAFFDYFQNNITF